MLAFLNLSGDPKDEYFSDGLSEELLNTLVRIEKLRVAARTSSFSFKGKSVDIPTVGRRFDVGAVLEGSVRKVEREESGSRPSSSTPSTGYHLWSQNFDRDFKDIIALQSEIATSCRRVRSRSSCSSQIRGRTTLPAARGIRRLWTHSCAAAPERESRT